MKNSKQSPESNICPDCQSRMVFAPDGRGLLCERCGFRHVVERDMPSAAELARAQKLLPQGDNADAQKLTNLRISFRQGIGAVKAKDMDEAFFHLQRVILSGDADEKMRAESWLWLSEVYVEQEDKRECLEQVLSLQPTHGAARRGMAIIDGRLLEEEIVDPNHIQRQTVEGSREARADQFTCSNCGSRTNFTADGQSLRCEFCGHEQSILKEGESTPQSEFGIGGMEQDFIAGLARVSGHVQPVATRTLQCQGCGIEFVLAPETLSVTCPYCDHVYVTETAETREILPAQAVLPFSITVDEVKKSLRQWFQQQKISRVQLSPIVGLYIPVWTFDLSGEITWRGYVRQGDDWVFRTGSGYVLEDDLLVPATAKPSSHLRRSLDDFDLEALVNYDPRYLADWPAERYQLALADASIAVRRDIMKRLRRHPHRITGGEHVRDLTLSSSGLSVLSYKLILLPMWMVHYQLEDKEFELFVNGQTGQVRGKSQQGVVKKLFSWLKGE